MIWACRPSTHEVSVDKASQRRWWIWLGLLGATIAAMVYPTEEDGAAVSEVAQPNRPATCLVLLL